MLQRNTVCPLKKRGYKKEEENWKNGWMTASKVLKGRIDKTYERKKCPLTWIIYWDRIVK